MSLTKSKTVYMTGYMPLMPGVHVAPYPYPHQLKYPEVLDSSSAEACGQECLAKLDLLLHQQVSPSDVACVLIEPVLGEGGYVAPPASFLQGLRQMCDQHNMLLVFDEVTAPPSAHCVPSSQR
jgi:4-aminobutyrate aminotransferase